MHKLIINEQNIQDKIFTLRGKKVMLDRDLAKLYGVKSIRLREQVKRNIKRFPDDFMFQLYDTEIDFMVSQNAIPSKQHLGGAKPYAFTEQGVSMLSSILKSDLAIEMSIEIIRAFVNMKKFISQNKIIFQRLESLKKHNEQYLHVEIKKFNSSHDRFLIVDETEVYHIGASLKDLGKKWFGFSKMDSESFEMIERLHLKRDATG